MNQQVGQHGELVVGDEFGCGLDEQRQGPWTGAAGVARQRRGRRLGLEARHVGGQQQISGSPLLTHLAEHPIDLPGRRRRHEIGLRTGDFPAHPQKVLEVAVAQRMMQRPARALRVLRRAADDVHDRHVLGVAARDRVGRRKLTDTECGYHSRHSAQSTVAVGGVSGVELIGVADPAQARMGDDVIEELQVVVAGHAEHFGDAEFGEAVQQIVTDGVGRARSIRRSSSHDVDATRLRSKPPSAWRGLAIVRSWQSTKPAKSSSRQLRRRSSTSSAILTRSPNGRSRIKAWRSSTRDKNGRPAKVKMKVKAAGITDEQVVAYTWGDNVVSWTLISSGQQRVAGCFVHADARRRQDEGHLRDQRGPASCRCPASC